MRIATTLLALISVLACTRLALADQPATSTDEARRIAEMTWYDAHATTGHVPVRVPAAPSSTDDFRVLAGARIHTVQPAGIQLAAMPQRVTSTDEARAAAGQAQRRLHGQPRVTSMQ